MQHIQWFPGHMTKAMRMMEENLKLVDGIIYVLDARAPLACINTNHIKIFNNKPVVYLINKCDLVESVHIKKIDEYFNGKNYRHAFVKGTDQRDINKALTLLKSVFEEKLKRNLEKGVNKTLRFMVCGIPNTGKSTIINTISGKKVAQTGDKAGVTKGKQWIKLDYLELLDTPGTMPPSMENQDLARHLAYIGSVNDDILDIEELCLTFIADMSAIQPGLFKEKYGADGVQPLEIYENICKKRGYLVRGGDYDYTRCAKAVIDDFRRGKLGKICLEF
ncbi:MAG: ribosome biogenesis GTPase YlqF [Christensenellaceae bacterium]